MQATGSLYLEGRFNGGVFALPDWGTYHGGAHFGNFRVFSDLYLEDMQWSRLREGRLGR